MTVIPDSVPYRLIGCYRGFVQPRLEPVLVSRPGDRVCVDAVLRKGATVRGKLLYNGEPWTNGSVYYELESGHRASGRISRGSYEISHVPTGSVTIAVRAHSKIAVVPDPVALVIEAGATYEHDFVLGRAACGAVAASPGTVRRGRRRSRRARRPSSSSPAVSI